ncbi:hypothetical protein L0244_17850 [bacterium]|nr:hypothetical protein [bacterium]
MDDAYKLLKIGSKHDQYIPYDYLMINPYLKRIKNDSRFKEFVQSSRNESEQTLLQLENARAKGILPKYLEQPISELRRQLY